MASYLPKVLANFRCNLAIRHLVCGFNASDPPSEFITLKPLPKLALCLTGPKIRIASASCTTRDDLVVVLVELVAEAPVLLVFFLRRPGCIGVRTTGKTDILLYV